MFKQIRDDRGKLIGLIYSGPRMDYASTLNFPQVLARMNIYRRRAEKGEASQAVEAGLQVWEWAVGLFEQGREALADATPAESLQDEKEVIL